MPHKSNKNYTIKAIFEAMDKDQANDLRNRLDLYKGSYAVEYVLECLLKKGNQHNLYSLLKLLRKKGK